MAGQHHGRSAELEVAEENSKNINLLVIVRSKIIKSNGEIYLVQCSNQRDGDLKNLVIVLRLLKVFVPLSRTWPKRYSAYIHFK